MTNELTRTKNTYTDEQIAQLESLVKTHNEGKSFESSYFIVDLTGEKQVYFTLYRYAKPTTGFVNPYRYIKNLSIDIVQAVEEILGRASNTAVLICYDDNNNPLLTGFRKRTKEGIPNVPFGKYKGMTIAEIWEKDRNWVMWFNKEYKTKPYTDFRGNLSSPSLSKEDVMLKDNANTLIKLFWEEWRRVETERNQEDCKSEFFGTLKMRLEQLFTVTQIKKYDESTIIYLEDNKNNIVYIYDKEYDLTIGTQYSITGTPTKHIEKLGKKMTYLNRVVINGKIINNQLIKEYKEVA